MINLMIFLMGIFLAILPLNTPEVRTFLGDSFTRVVESVQVAPTPTESVTPAPTETSAPTPTPTPGPSSTPWMNEEDTAALNQKIQDFLDKTGDYTPEKISAKMFDLSGMFDKTQIQLGLVDATHV